MAESSSFRIQILGDSHAKRFAAFLARTGGFSGALHVAVDLGVSGLTIPELKTRIKSDAIVLDPALPAVVYIGTNDILQGTDCLTIGQQFKSLVRLLHRRFPDMPLILPQIPVFPRARNTPFEGVIASLNRIINSFSATRVAVLCVSPFGNNENYFCAFYGRSNRRDGIHFNDTAYRAMVGLIGDSLRSMSTVGVK